MPPPADSSPAYALPNAPAGRLFVTEISGHMAVPVNVTTRMPPGTLVIVSEPLFAPVVVGTNDTSTVVEAPAASAADAGAPPLNCDASRPPIGNGGVNVTVAVLVLVIVTVCVAVVPSGTVPKSTFDAENSGGAIALARFCGLPGEIDWKSLALSPASVALPAAPPGLRS